LTPERFLDFEGLVKVDFFIIDEFYKLSDDDPERASALNQAFYKLLGKTHNFYLLGPLIDSIPEEFEKIFPKTFVKSEFETVALDFKIKIPKKFEVLEALLKNENEPCLIYCGGPGTCENLAKEFADSITESEYVDLHKDIHQWSEKFIHKSWLQLDCLPKGVAFHHGAMPRHVGKYLVDAFNEKKIKYLFCTSTLMEGVNTAAKSVFVWELKKGKNNLTSFDFRNISGRAGRLGKFFVGNVNAFGTPPINSKQDVDFWWLTQVKAPDELLIQLNSEDMKDESKARLEKIIKSSLVSIEELKKNTNVSIIGQNSLKAELAHNANIMNSLESWNSFPTWDQLNTACELIWKNLILKPKEKEKAYQDEIASGAQLAVYTWKYYQEKSLSELIEEVIKNEIARMKKDEDRRNPEKVKKAVNRSIRTTMIITRRWFEFRLPKLLTTLNRICLDINPNFKGDFTIFASAIENGFLQVSLASLREIGIPIEVANKVNKLLSPDAREDLEKAMVEIKNLVSKNPEKFHPYEVYLLKDI
jgi:hypothetical protein